MNKYTYRQINKHKRILKFSEYELDKYFGKEENIEPSFYCAFINGNYKVAKIIYDKHKNNIDISKPITNIFGCRKTTLLHKLFETYDFEGYMFRRLKTDQIYNLFNLIYEDQNLSKILQKEARVPANFPPYIYTPLMCIMRGIELFPSENKFLINKQIISKIINHPSFTYTLDPAVFFHEIYIRPEYEEIFSH
jgi:hypothetical protein